MAEWLGSLTKHLPLTAVGRNPSRDVEVCRMKVIQRVCGMSVVLGRPHLLGRGWGHPGSSSIKYSWKVAITLTASPTLTMKLEGNGAGVKEL